jgi:hypothetical protein
MLKKRIASAYARLSNRSPGDSNGNIPVYRQPAAEPTVVAFSK